MTKNQTPSNITFKKLIKSTWTVFKENFTNLILLNGIIYIPFGILNAFFAPDTSNSAFNQPETIPQYTGAYIIISILMIPLSAFVTFANVNFAAESQKNINQLSKKSTS